MDNQYLLISDVLTEIEVPEKGIVSHTVFNDQYTKIILFGFAPRQQLTAHTAPMPATIQILRGEATLTLGADACEVSPGCLIYMPPQLVHGVVARTPLHMLLILHKAGRQGTAETGA